MTALIRTAMADLGPSKVAGKPSVQTGVVPWLVTLAIAEHQPNSVLFDRYIVPLTDLDDGGR
jgi:hypothetical protein